MKSATEQPHSTPKKRKQKRLPLHARIREQLRNVILNEFKDGDRLTPEPELIQRLAVSQGTVRRALKDLTDEGLLVRKVPSGTFIRIPSYEFKFVGIILPHYDSSYKNVVLDHIATECEKRNLHVLIHHTHENRRAPETLQALQTNPTETRYLLMGNDIQSTTELCRGLFKRGFSAVTIDSPGNDHLYNHVGVDNAMGIKLGLEHLVARGHQRITFLVNEQLNRNVRERIQAFKHFGKVHQLKDLEIINCETNPNESAFAHAYQSMEQIWHPAKRPTAIITASQTGALAALKWCAEREIKVPSHLAIVSFDDYKENQYVHPSLTSIAQPLEQIAHQAINLLLADRPKKAGREFLLPPELIVRDSS